MVNKVSEKLLEKKLSKEVKLLGGQCLKFTSPYFTGMPDRMILLPKGKVHFVELKSTSGRLSKRQKIVHAMLRDLKQGVTVIYDNNTLYNFIEQVKLYGI